MSRPILVGCDPLTEEAAGTPTEKIRQDPHPSTTQMAILEQTIPAPLVRDYLNILLEKVLKDPSPSISMIRRVQRVADSP